jgi:DNA-binding XRE family transcriptional regulator
MLTKFSELRNRMPIADQQTAKRKASKIIKGLLLDELRQSVEMTQERLASVLNMKQSSVSKMEKQGDMYLSTLRKYVEGVGAELEIKAKMKGKTIPLALFMGKPGHTFAFAAKHARAVARHAKGKARPAPFSRASRRDVVSRQRRSPASRISPKGTA